jgi:cobalamin biosynthesis protein CobT
MNTRLKQALLRRKKMSVLYPNRKRPTSNPHSVLIGTQYRGDDDDFGKNEKPSRQTAEEEKKQEEEEEKKQEEEEEEEEDDRKTTVGGDSLGGPTNKMEDDDEEKRWRQAVQRKAESMQDGYYHLLKNLIPQVGEWAAAARAQGICSGTEVGNMHHPACGGKYRLTPETVFTKSTQFAHYEIHRRHNNRSLGIYCYIANHKVDQCREFLKTGRFLHIECHGLETSAQLQKKNSQ